MSSSALITLLHYTSVIYLCWRTLMCLSSPDPFLLPFFDQIPYLVIAAFATNIINYSFMTKSIDLEDNQVGTPDFVT